MVRVKIKKAVKKAKKKIIGQKDILEDLINLDGVSGDEEEVRGFIIRECKKYLKEVKVDNMGNVVAVKPGKRPAIMFLAHMDEIGLMISSIDKEGRIYISPIGGVDPHILLGQRVYLISQKGRKIGGIVTNLDVLESVELTKSIQMSDLFIYTGLNKQQLADKGIEVGSYVIFAEGSRYSTLGSEEYISGKALDNRIGCYTLLEVMKNLNVKNEVIFVFTVQEEVGLYGAKASVFNLEPDYAIAVDVTPFNSYNEVIVTGRGPVLTVKDAEMISNRCLDEAIEDAAKNVGVNIQREVSELGTTDAASIFVAKGGIPSAVFGVAVGNLHTGVSTASRKDIDESIKVLKELLKRPPTKCWR